METFLTMHSRHSYLSPQTQWTPPPGRCSLATPCRCSPMVTPRPGSQASTPGPCHVAGWSTWLPRAAGIVGLHNDLVPDIHPRYELRAGQGGVGVAEGVARLGTDCVKSYDHLLAGAPQVSPPGGLGELATRDPDTETHRMTGDSNSGSGLQHSEVKIRKLYNAMFGH